MAGEGRPDSHDGSEREDFSSWSQEDRNLSAEAVRDALWEAASPEERERITRAREERAARAEQAEQAAQADSQARASQAREVIADIDQPLFPPTINSERMNRPSQAPPAEPTSKRNWRDRFKEFMKGAENNPEAQTGGNNQPPPTRPVDGLSAPGGPTPESSEAPLPKGRDAKLFEKMLEGEPGGAGVYNRHPTATKEMLAQLQSNGIIGEKPVTTIKDTYALRRRTGLKSTLHNLKEWELSQSVPTGKSIAEIDLYDVAGRKDAALAVTWERGSDGKYEIAGWSTLLTEKKKPKKKGEEPPPGHEEAFVYDEIRKKRLPSNALRAALADSNIAKAATTSRVMPESKDHDPQPSLGPDVRPEETAGWSIAARENMAKRMDRMEQERPSQPEEAAEHGSHGDHEEHVPEVSDAQVAAAEAAAQANEASAQAAAEKMSRQQAAAEKELMKLEKYRDLRAIQLLSYSDVLTGDELDASIENTKSDPISQKYKEVLKQAFRGMGEEEFLKIANSLQEKALDEMKYFDIEPTKYGDSISWAAWDLAKQKYFATNPAFSTEEYRDNLADPLVDNEAGRQKRQEIIDRHVGWELDTAVKEGRVEKSELSLSIPGAVEVLDEGERNDTNQLRSFEYARLGKVVRELREVQEEEARVKAEAETKAEEEAKAKAKEEAAKVKAEADAKAKAEEEAKAEKKGKKKDKDKGKDKDKSKSKGKDKVKDKEKDKSKSSGGGGGLESLAAPTDSVEQPQSEASPTADYEERKTEPNVEAGETPSQDRPGADLLGSIDYSVSGNAKFSELVRSVQEADREAGAPEEKRFGVAPAGQLSPTKVRRILGRAMSKGDIKAIEQELVARDEQNHRDQNVPLRFERRKRSNGDEYIVGVNGTGRKIISEISERREALRNERDAKRQAKTASRNEQERNGLVDLTDDWNEGRENQRNDQMQTGLGGNNIETAESDGEREAYIARQRILSQQESAPAAAPPEPASYSERDTDDEMTGFSAVVNRIRQADPNFDIPKTGALNDEQVSGLLNGVQSTAELESIQRELFGVRQMPQTEAMNIRHDELAEAEVAQGNYGDEARNEVAKRFEEMAEPEADRSDWEEMIDEAVNVGLAQRSESARLGIEAEEGSIQSEAFVAKMNELFPEGEPENNAESEPEGNDEAEQEKREADLAGSLLDEIRNVNLRERDETRRNNRLASIYARAVQEGLAAPDNSAVPYGISAPNTPTVGSIIFWAGFEQSQQRPS